MSLPCDGCLSRNSTNNAPIGDPLNSRLIWMIRFAWDAVSDLLKILPLVSAAGRSRSSSMPQVFRKAEITSFLLRS
ncbi:hypothetical protein D3C81_2240570 [compost metagenome]